MESGVLGWFCIPQRAYYNWIWYYAESPEYSSNTAKKITSNTKGVTTSFGFRRRPVTAPAIANNTTAAKRLAQQEIIDRNGNADDTESLTSNAIPPGRTTPKLAPPKKEANATKINRFGFRQLKSDRLNKISDINSQLENRNNNRITSGPQQLRYTLQSNQLPKPQFPLHIIDTKTAKTLANTCKKASRMYRCENNSSSSKDGSFTEDSGVGSHTSSGNGENDTLHGVELNDSPPIQYKPRRFDMVLSGINFDLRDLDDSTEPLVPIPSLPSVFQHKTGLVHNRRFEYEKQLQRRKMSSSSDGFSDDYNSNLDNVNIPKTFLKTSINRETSPLSSDQEWGNGGEAMADDFSYSCSSSDEISTPALALQNFMNASMSNKTAPIHEIRNVLLTIEDPKFAAVANNSAGYLLDDETSPVDSLICSESEDLTKHFKLTNDNKINMEKSTSNSKDINEKDGSSSPGTPTNASNSLSLSDGKDYFDDEIADQPALVFDDTLTSTEQISESTPTLIDSTPKPKRKFFGSPLLLRRKTLLNSTVSVDTLSPCESIASDDLMMDFDHSQSSGLDDTLERIDTHRNSLGSLEDTALKIQANKTIDSVWAVCIGSGSNIGSPISAARPSRLLRSRGSTSSGSKPESPCSFDSSRNCHSLTRSPLRLQRSALNSHSGYDSDDSIKLDRANHGAMAQDVVQIKTMLIKLRRIINESDTLNPFDTQPSLKNGLFNGLSSASSISLEEDNTRFEMADLRRQVLFLQGQLEDREQSLHFLHQKMEQLVLDTETAKSAPASTVASEVPSVNAATQTERIRPISAGPSLLEVSPTDGSMGSLVSVSERKSRSSSSSSSSSIKRNQPSLWRKPGEPPLPQIIYGTSNTSSSSNIPKRAKSRTRTPLTPV